MKKIVSILFLFVIMTGFSQDLIIRYNGNIYDNNDTIFVKPRFLNSDDTFYIDIENNTSQQLGIMVLRDPISLLSSATTQFCIGESCLDGNVSVFPQMINAGENYSHAEYGDTTFHIIYNPNGERGVSIMKFKLFDQTTPTIETNFYIVLDSRDVAIEENTITGNLSAFPNPASTKVTFEHNITNLSPEALLVIRNITGSVITKELIGNNNKLSISLENYNPGIYFYSIENEGKAIVTKKLIVK
jgi:hypothetical protein